MSVGLVDLSNFGFDFSFSREHACTVKVKKSCLGLHLSRLEKDVEDIHEREEEEKDINVEKEDKVLF